MRSSRSMAFYVLHAIIHGQKLPAALQRKAMVSVVTVGTGAQCEGSRPTAPPRPDGPGTTPTRPAESADRLPAPRHHRQTPADP